MSYERTAEHRAKMSAALKGRRHNYRSASTSPKIAKKIQNWWTPERREAKRQQMLKRNPNALYHGLSARQAKAIVNTVGYCHRCNSTKRLDIHHIDRDKHNHAATNLEVLCHRCHMQEHALTDETGWQVYHRRKNRRD